MSMRRVATAFCRLSVWSFGFHLDFSMNVYHSLRKKSTQIKHLLATDQYTGSITEKNAYKNVTKDGEGRRFAVINMNIGRFLNISYSTDIASWCRTNEYFFMPTVKAETKY